MMRDQDRGTGRTTAQIRNAPFGAVYVCKTQDFVRYCSDIAARLERKDLRFVSLNAVRNGHLRGLSCNVVFDHDCEATPADLQVA